MTVDVPIDVSIQFQGHDSKGWDTEDFPVDSTFSVYENMIAYLVHQKTHGTGDVCVYLCINGKTIAPIFVMSREIIPSVIKGLERGRKVHEEINGAIAVCKVVGELKARVDSFISKKEAKE